MREYTTDSRLLGRLGAAEQEAWVEFLTRYGDLIRLFAQRRGIPAADCDDVVQEVLTELLRAMPKFDYDRERGRFRGFLKTVTVRAIARRFRQDERRRRQEEAAAGADVAPDDDADWEIAWRRSHLQRALRKVESEFAERDRRAFQRYAIEGADVAETAETFGMSVDAVYQIKSRILRRLKSIVAEQVADEQ